MNTGSSPLARGLRSIVLPRNEGHGIIPARAGFTDGSWRSRVRELDHPRSRGVYFLEMRRSLAAEGSSPLARGLLAVGAARKNLHRIIPARAGFTACGSVRPPSAPGSSPLARGLPTVSRATGSRPRIIPARAGFTPCLMGDRCGLGDHPRSRGVYLVGWVTVWSVKGIIPARAGFTRRGPRPRPTVGDHPRSRGVYSTTMTSSICSSGSSPLARGLLPVGVPDADRLGIIPARAGFTGGADDSHDDVPDHPRSRGVYRRS